MAEKAEMSFEFDEELDAIEVRIQINSDDAVDRDATFHLNQRVRVNDSDPRHGSKVLYHGKFHIEQRIIKFSIPASKFTGFCYDGSQIEIEYQGTLKIDDGVFFDTKVAEEVTY